MPQNFQLGMPSSVPRDQQDVDDEEEDEDMADVETELFIGPPRKQNY